MRKPSKPEVDTSKILPIEAPVIGIEAIPNAFLWPVKQLRPNPEQPRSSFDIEEVINLAVNLKRLADKGQGIAGLGFIHALAGHWQSGQFDESGEVPPDAVVNITAGENRWRAATLLYEGRLDVTPDYKILSYEVLRASKDRADVRFGRVPIVVTSQTSLQARRNALFENIMRQSLPILDEARELRALMNEEGLSFKQAAEYVGKTKSWVQARLDALRAGDDVQRLIQSRPDTLFAAQRIDRVKEPEVRQLMIDLVEGKVAYPKIAGLKDIAAIPDSRQRKGVIRKIRESVDKGEFDANRALAEMRKHLPSDFRADDETYGDDSDNTTYGSKGNGHIIAPRYNLADTLDGVLRELQSATLTPSLRKALKPKIAQLMEILGE